jgi:hypothetical protein
MKADIKALYTDFFDGVGLLEGDMDVEVDNIVQPRHYIICPPPSVTRPSLSG